MNLLQYERQGIRAEETNTTLFKLFDLTDLETDDYCWCSNPTWFAGRQIRQ